MIVGLLLIGYSNCMITSESSLQDGPRPNKLRALLPAKGVASAGDIYELLTEASALNSRPVGGPDLFYTTRRMIWSGEVTNEGDWYEGFMLPFETPVTVQQRKAGCFVVRAEFWNHQEERVIKSDTLESRMIAAQGLMKVLRDGGAIRAGIHIDTGAWVAEPDVEPGFLAEQARQRVAYEQKNYPGMSRAEIDAAEEEARAKMMVNVARAMELVRAGKIDWPPIVIGGHYEQD